MNSSIVKTNKNKLKIYISGILSEVDSDPTEFDYESAPDEYSFDFTKVMYDNFIENLPYSRLYEEVKYYYENPEIYPEFYQSLENMMARKSVKGLEDLKKEDLVELFKRDKEWEYFSEEGFNEDIIKYYQDEINDKVNDLIQKYTYEEED